MPRATNTQKAERLNAVHRLLARGTSTAEIAQVLSRDFALSRRQAYRYLREAQAIGHSVPRVEPAVPITLKVSADVVRQLRAYAAASGLTMGEIVARSVIGFLADRSKHG
jgi:predicted DNA-binding transcriptional regulator YafY